MALLVLEDVEARYGPIKALHGVSLAVEEGATIVRVEERVRTLHSYDVPEVIAVPIRMGSAPYLGWLADATARGA